MAYPTLRRMDSSAAAPLTFPPPWPRMTPRELARLFADYPTATPGERLRSARLHWNLSRPRLSALSKVPLSTIKRLETSGGRMSDTTATELARGFEECGHDVPAAWFLNGWGGA